MAVGDTWPWVPAVIALLLVAPAPAMADQVVFRFQDEGALLVGDPTGQAEVHTQQRVLGQDVDVGTHKAYTFAVEPADNRLEIDLTYDAGDVGIGGPCLKANDLDLYVEGPEGWSRAYPGCDAGEIRVVDDHVPPGEYTLQIEAERGSTVCVPDDPSPCTLPGVEYRLALTVWSIG